MVGVGHTPFQTRAEAEEAAPSLNPGRPWQVVEADDPRQALSKVIGVPLPPGDKG